MKRDFFIGENDFRVWLPDVSFVEKSEEAYNSRQLFGIMSTNRIDRQGEDVVSKGLLFDDFISNGHFNDNHSQDTSAIVGYPEEVHYHQDMKNIDPKLEGAEGWTCKGYMLKGTKRSDGIWELAKALQSVPNKKLGFSIEGKVIRRKNKTIEKANIRNIAITNCPVNTDAQWNILAKSFSDEGVACKALTAGFATSPGAQSGGGAIRTESLDSDVKDTIRRRRRNALKRALELDDLEKAMEIVLDTRPDFEEEAAAYFIASLYRGGKI